MPYIPHTPDEVREMLDALGVASTDDLFRDIPDALKIDGLDLPAGLSEFEASQRMADLAGRNRGTDEYSSFLGGGAYEHYIPAAVPALALRGEFATAYTPYQAEASQGTLQAVYEFQSMLCALTSLDVANASLYDGASALGEAVLMAMRLAGRRETVAVPATLNPRYEKALRTYVENLGTRLVELPCVEGGAVSDVERLKEIASEHADDLAAVIVPVTNFFGACEPWREMAAAAKEAGAIVIAVANPMSLSVLPGPGDWGADICVGEAQPLGLPLSWGGPYCGYMTCRQDHIRKMPGRIVGCTVDADGRRGYTLTLQTREQHIRRDKATSNICTNQGLMALQVCIYLALVGKDGFRRIGLANLERAGLLRDMLTELDGVELVTEGDVFNEFTVRLPVPATQAAAAMKQRGILAGLETDANPNWLVVCATETKSRADLEAYTAALRDVLREQPVAAPA